MRACLGGRSGGAHRAAGWVAAGGARGDAAFAAGLPAEGVLLEHAGACQVRVLLADYELRELRRLAPGGAERADAAGGGRRWGRRRACRARSDGGCARNVLAGEAEGCSAMAAMTGLVKDELSRFLWLALAGRARRGGGRTVQGWVPEATGSYEVSPTSGVPKSISRPTDGSDPRQQFAPELKRVRPDGRTTPSIIPGLSVEQVAAHWRPRPLACRAGGR